MLLNFITPLGRRAHLVLALLAGAPLVLLGLTGTLLVFGAEVDTSTAPALRRSSSADRTVTARMVATAVERASGGLPHTLFFPENPGRAVEGWLDAAGTRRVYVDGASGQVLGVREERRAWLGFVRTLHVDLLGGDEGHTAVGIAGLAALALVSSGLLRWWSARRNVVAFRVRTPVTGARGAYDLHRIVGLPASVLLLLSAVSGAALVFPSAAAALLAAPVRPPPPGPAEGPPFKVTSLDALVARADAALPGGRISRVHLPQAPGAPLRVRKRLPGETHPFGLSFVHVSTSGEVLRSDDARRASWQDRLLALRFPVHTGAVLGLPGRILMALAGLSPLWLAATGLIFWRHRRLARRRARSSPSPAVARTSHVSA